MVFSCRGSGSEALGSRAEVSVAGAELVELDLSTSHSAWSRAVSAFADVSGVEGGGASGITVVGRMLEKLRLVWIRHCCGD